MSWLLATLVFAQSDNRTDGMAGIQQAFRNEATYSVNVVSLVTFVISVIALIFVLVLIYRMYQRKSSLDAQNCPLRLFRHCLTQMGVGASDRWMLRRMAKQAKLAQPVVILFSLELLDKYGLAWANAASTPTGRSRRLRRIEELKPSLFA